MLSSFFSVFSMENILQSLIKIIIIGSFYKTTSVDCNPQFLPPRLPYYPNGNFFIPDLAPHYHEPLPVYYREENPPPPPPPPISYQNMNAYPPPQLFHRNENYNPVELASPNVRYSPPQIFPYKPKYNQPYKVQPTFNRGIGFKKPSQNSAETQVRSTESPKKKPAFFSTNIIIKEESQPSYYSDDYNKNYHDEDYSDNYSDESPSQPDPCQLNSLYRYFEPPKIDPNNPNDDKYTLCGPYFQPNFGNGIYTVKMPITLLPSRFPPRIEQLIERIQNYFSTYTQTLKPENETLTTPQPNIQDPVNATIENFNKTNSTQENLQPSPEQINLNPSTAAIENEEVTQQTIVAIIQSEESTPSPPMPDVQNKNESEGFDETIQATIELITTSTETPQEGFPVGEQQTKVELETPKPIEATQKPVENQNYPEIEIVLIDSKGLESTTESAMMNNRTEEIFTLKEGLLKINVTDSNG